MNEILPGVVTGFDYRLPFHLLWPDSNGSVIWNEQKTVLLDHEGRSDTEDDYIVSDIDDKIFN